MWIQSSDDCIKSEREEGTFWFFLCQGIPEDSAHCNNPKYVRNMTFFVPKLSRTQELRQAQPYLRSSGHRAVSYQQPTNTEQPNVCTAESTVIAKALRSSWSSHGCRMSMNAVEIAFDGMKSHLRNTYQSAVLLKAKAPLGAMGRMWNGLYARKSQEGKITKLSLIVFLPWKELGDIRPPSIW